MPVCVTEKQPRKVYYSIWKQLVHIPDVINTYFTYKMIVTYIRKENRNNLSQGFSTFVATNRIVPGPGRILRISKLLWEILREKNLKVLEARQRKKPVSQGEMGQGSWTVNKSEFAPRFRTAKGCVCILDHFRFFCFENFGLGSMSLKVFEIAYIVNVSKAFWRSRWTIMTDD